MHRDKVPGDLCVSQLPELLPGGRGPGHVKRCHLKDPDAVFARLQQEQPELAVLGESDLGAQDPPDPQVPREGQGS